MAGPKIEVYGFVAWMSSFVVFGVYLVWAYFPESFLEQVGITWYPNKYWAVSIPIYIVVTWLTSIIIYGAINFYLIERFDSIHTITDEHAQETDEEMSSFRIEEGIPPIADIPITVVNKFLYL